MAETTRPRPEDFPTYSDFLRAWEADRRRRQKAQAQRERRVAQRPPSAAPTRTAGKHLSPGEAHYNARLTEADVRSIRQRHADGEARSSLAQAFAITPRMVNLIVTRRRWNHITD